MSPKKIATDKAPAAIGPYSQGVRAGGFCFFSGQIPLDPVSGELVSGGIVEQTEQVLRNIAALLDEAGLGPESVVKTTIYLTDLGDFARVNEIYGRFFGESKPARATVEVAGLPRGAKIEIEWICYSI
jgi:2-iminobutanoate/2-iminopropanoate deaminase